MSSAILSTMKVMRHIGLRLDNEEERAKFIDIGVEFASGAKMPGGGIVATIDLPEDDARWRRIELLLGGRRTLDSVASTFSSADLYAAKFLRIVAKSGGYPQPENKNGYLSATYDLTDYCPRCGIGKRQVAPFRFKGPPALRNNSIIQLNWIFDEYFVSAATWEAVFKPLGIEKRPVVLHKSGLEVQSPFQLDIPYVCDLKLEGAGYTECPYCERKKYSPIFRGFLPEPVEPSTSIFKSSQSFGSGALAFKLVIVSADTYRIFKDIDLKDAKFYACANEQGHVGTPAAPPTTL
jgi:hypothetical protein